MGPFVRLVRLVGGGLLCLGRSRFLVVVESKEKVYVERTSQITQLSKGLLACWSNSVPHATQTRRSGLSGDVVVVMLGLCVEVTR